MGERGRVAALDGVRGLAILLVITEHARLPGTRYFGTAGVTLFFVLSGYLITGILLRERDRTGTVDLRAFWLRRAARLVPALFLMLAVVVAFVGSRAVPPALGAATYTSNYHRWWWGGFDHTWSLAVEVHFYVLWTAALFLLPRRWLIPVAATMGVVSLAIRVRYGIIAFPTEANLWAPMLGSVLALRGVAPPTWRALRWPPLVALGTISYGVYLWHYPLLSLEPWNGAERGIVVVASVLIAAVSWRFVERPAISWARGLGDARRAAQELEHDPVLRGGPAVGVPHSDVRRGE